MLTPKDFGLFMFDSFRPFQLETALRVKGAFERGVKLVLVQAPTGLGKTVIAVLVAMMLEVNMVYTCHTKALQRQFMRDFSQLGAEELLGRRNYPCLKHRDLFPRISAELCTWDRPNCRTCDLSKQGCRPDSGGRCPCKSVCPYEIQKQKTELARIGVQNVPYYLRATNYAGAFRDRDLVVLDEVDQTDPALMSLIELSIPETLMKKYDLSRPEFKSKPESWYKWAVQTLETVKQRLSALQGLWGVDDLVAEHQLSRLKAKLEFFIADDVNGWVYDGNSSFKPIWIRKYANHFLWRHAKRFLGMSATISPWRQLVYDLGISPSEVEFVDLQSVFDPARRPIYYDPRANMNHKSKAAEFPNMVAGIDHVMERHSAEKGLIHCVSYPNARYILEHSRHKHRLISHDNTNRDAQLQHFIVATEPLVLLSPSMERGTDLPYDLCRFIIIAKVPYPDREDPQVSARLYRSGSAGQAWYAATTARRLVQATGRGVRAPDDYCVSYILDSAFGEFYQRNLVAFPRWWREALVMKGGDAIEA